MVANDGRRIITFRLMGIFETSDRKIVAWRDYFHRRRQLDSMTAGRSKSRPLLMRVYPRRCSAEPQHGRVRAIERSPKALLPLLPKSTRTSELTLSAMALSYDGFAPTRDAQANGRSGSERLFRTARLNDLVWSTAAGTADGLHLGSENWLLSLAWVDTGRRQPGLGGHSPAMCRTANSARSRQSAFARSERHIKCNWADVGAGPLVRPLANAPLHGDEPLLRLAQQLSRFRR